jgi:NADPH-dependent 2,4-dienoyl-CoA reductase/sulfur reductase-like enzyme
MEAARVAALRGHQVTLCERRQELGGELIPAAKPPHKKRLEALARYFAVQLQALAVDVKLGSEATVQSVKDAGGDVVVIATGAVPAVPALPGIDSPTVIHARDVLLGRKEVCGRVVVIGGGMVGCETAEFLLERGMSVTLVEMLPELAMNMRPTLRKALLQRIAAKPIDIFTGARCTRITEEYLEIIDNGGKIRQIKGCSVVLAIGGAANDKLFSSLEGEALNLRRVGDCIRPRGIAEAIEEGMQLDPRG